MTILNSIIRPNAREPSGRCLLGGKAVDGWSSLQVENNGYYAADTFAVVYAIADLKAPYTLGWFAKQGEIKVQIDFDDGTGSKTFMLGYVDKISYDPHARTVTLTGRDMTAKFIDAKTTEKWKNLTASQIATTLAKRHGLTPVVTATKTKVGAYYNIDHVQDSQEESEWDLLAYLARNEGFVCYVRGNKLYFKPDPEQSKADVYKVYWKETADGPVSNVLWINFERDLTVSKGISVTVQSFNSAHKKLYSFTYPKGSGKGTKPGESAPKVQSYFFRYPGRTQEQVTQIAQQKYKEIIQHEMLASISAIGDNLLMPDVMLAVTGTDSQFDQKYWVDSVTRSFDMQSGYAMIAKAKNHNPNSNPSPNA